MRKEVDLALRLTFLASTTAACGSINAGTILATRQAENVAGAISTLEAAGIQFPPPTPTTTPFSGVIIEHADGTREEYPIDGKMPNCSGFWGCSGEKSVTVLNGTPVPGTETDSHRNRSVTIAGLGALGIAGTIYFGPKKIRKEIKRQKAKNEKRKLISKI